VPATDPMVELMQRRLLPGRHTDSQCTQG